MFCNTIFECWRRPHSNHICIEELSESFNILEGVKREMVLPHISVTLTYCNAIGNGASSVDAFFRLLMLPERFSIFQPTSPNHLLLY